MGRRTEPFLRDRPEDQHARNGIDWESNTRGTGQTGRATRGERDRPEDQHAENGTDRKGGFFRQDERGRKKRMTGIANRRTLKMKIGIVGYGNLGRGVEKAVNANPDQELVAVFTRRDPSTVTIATPGAAVKHTDELAGLKDEIDVLILCGGQIFRR